MSTFDYNCLSNLPYVQQQIICFVAFANNITKINFAICYISKR